ncbi:MAG: hypothetical protein J7501_13055 [Bdellovibrio sp.]|nr:hypothetical protein [Bdellovibrio sp.]
MDSMASQTVSDIACKDQKLEEKMWDGIKSYLIEQKSVPSADALKVAFHTQVAKLADANPRLTSDDVRRIQGDLDKLVDSLLVEAPQGERVQTSEELLTLLSAIDVGDRSTTFRSYMQDRVRSDFTQLSKTVQSYELDCPANTGNSSQGETATATPTPTPSPTPNYSFEYQKQQALAAGVPLAVFGERWAFATAYQSCQAVQLAPMNNQTEDLKGIQITGKHSDGVGNKRVIASLSQVQTTHPYIKGMSSSGYGEGCFNVRSSPLIYDYGGKPYATTASTSPIDFFKNNGSGTSVLGVDCSAYIYTSMATAGLRMKEGRALKASDSWAWGSTSYVEPQSNGLTCLSKISITASTSIKPGDIVAVPGHVLMIDRAGSDPFGIASAKTTSDCSNLSVTNFDFSVAQSSPSKEGVGINHFEARYYLPTSEKMQAGLLKYAYYACLAKVNSKTYTPNLGTLSVVRHKGTTACMDKRVAVARESCIQACPTSSFAN